ncbi:jg2196 [Pararge aegeria aegeria]|uniref:Jg2196 protein n=1 Tax=Pararge aegeria aegeria TaxID=348720 RepID=A0A8S4QHH1_9NEOP|nr:jg2196 [Pararge aegeria aegeria]
MMNQSYRHSSASRKAEVEMGGAPIARRTDGRLDSEVLDWRPRTRKRSVSRSKTSWTDVIKRPAKDRMPSIGLQSVEMMMMIKRFHLTDRPPTSNSLNGST